MNNKKKLIRMLPLFLGATSLMSQTKPTPVPVINPTDADRHVLPIKQPLPESITIYDARKATPPPRFAISAPTGAPNVLIVLIDDMGFGQPSAFGGPVHMPTMEHLANAGLRYNNFHTTALCSPTRSALMTGRNHHMVNMGGITEVATAYPGNTRQRRGHDAGHGERTLRHGRHDGKR